MKNIKKLYFIFVFLITLFSFNMNVNAAQELTCLYNEWFGNFEDKHVLLIQYSNGNRVVFLNDKNVGIDDAGWKKTNLSGDNINVLSMNSNGTLNSCPAFANIGNDGVEFSDDEGWFKNIIRGVTPLDKKNSILGINEPDQYVSIVQPKLLNTEPDSKNFCDSDSSWLIDFESDEYTAACLYRYDSDPCHVIQINFGKNLMQVTEYDFSKKLSKSGFYDYYSQDGLNYTYGSFNIHSDFNAKNMISKADGKCINGIIVLRNDNIIKQNESISYRNDTKIFLTKDKAKNKGVSYFLINTKGTNPMTGEKLSMSNFDVQFEKTQINSCEDLLGEEISRGLKSVWNFVKIFIPILVFCLSCLDFAKVVFAGKEDDMKKAQSKFIKRIIITAVLFMVPVLLGVIFNIANNIWGNIGTDICGILL